MIRFFTIITIDEIHLIFKWWLSDRTKIRFRFEFKNFESRAWDWSIVNLIRINDDNNFFTFSIINKIFSDISEFIVHISQCLISVSTHLSELMQIDDFIRLDSESFLQFVRHFVLEILEKCFLIIQLRIAR
jgi:hypothetical protein